MKEAAVLLGIPFDTIRRAVADGIIRGVKLRAKGSSRILIPASELHRILEGSWASK